MSKKQPISSVKSKLQSTNKRTKTQFQSKEDYKLKLTSLSNNRTQAIYVNSPLNSNNNTQCQTPKPKRIKLYTIKPNQAKTPIPSVRPSQHPIHPNHIFNNNTPPHPHNNNNNDNQSANTNHNIPNIQNKDLRPLFDQVISQIDALLRISSSSSVPPPASSPSSPLSSKPNTKKIKKKKINKLKNTKNISVNINTSQTHTKPPRTKQLSIQPHITDYFAPIQPTNYNDIIYNIPTPNFSINFLNWYTTGSAADHPTNTNVNIPEFSNTISSPASHTPPPVTAPQFHLGLQPDPNATFEFIPDDPVTTADNNVIAPPVPINSIVADDDDDIQTLIAPDDPAPVLPPSTKPVFLKSFTISGRPFHSYADTDPRSPVSALVPDTIKSFTNQTRPQLTLPISQYITTLQNNQYNINQHYTSTEYRCQSCAVIFDNQHYSPLIKKYLLTFICPDCTHKNQHKYKGIQGNNRKLICMYYRTTFYCTTDNCSYKPHNLFNT